MIKQPLPMLGPTGLSLLATSIGVDKNRSDSIIVKAAGTVFGNDAGLNITKIVSDQYKGDVKPFQLKKSIEELGVNFPRCSSCPEETVCSSKCEECEVREAHLVNLVNSKDEMNRNLQTRVSQVLDEYSPSQTAHLEGLSEKIREQGDVISSLSSQLHELGICRDGIDEKDKRIAQFKSLVSERNETIAQLESVIQKRDSEISEGNRIIHETKDTLKKLRLTNSSHVSKILQGHLEDLARRDILMQKLSTEKKLLESRVLELGSVVSSNSSLLVEKKVLEERVASLVKSIDSTSARVLELDSIIISLNQQLVQRDETVLEAQTSLKKLEEELSECRSSATFGNEELHRKVTAKELDIQNLIKDTNDNIKSHEERLSFKSKQYSDLVGEKSVVEKKYSDLKKSLTEKEEGMKKASSRISEMEKERDALSKQHEKEKASHKENTGFLNTKVYETSKKLSNSESSLKIERTNSDLCTKNLDEKNDEIIRLEGVIEEMRIKAGEDETFNRATSYIRDAPENRNPGSSFLNKKYANLFWVGTGRSKHTRVTLEPGGNGKVTPTDVLAFWNQAFKNFGSQGPRKIMVSSPVDNTPVSVSLENNESFKTWVRVRKANSCFFEPTGTSNISKIRSKEFLLWLYIIHLGGLVGNDGEVLIPAGSVSSAFKFSDMFKW